MSSPPLSMWSWIGTGFAECDSVPLTDRGFRYGMSVFESVRIHRSQPQYLEEHLKRLRAGCLSRELVLEEEAARAVGDLLRGWAGEVDGFARIYVTAGDGASIAPADHCRVFVFIEARERPTRPAFDLMIAEELCHLPFEGLKTGNYWINLDGLQRAHREEKDEMLLFNFNAELISACVANVFLVHGSTIRTPSTECGARPGVMREQVMQRLKVEECSLFVDDLMSADEIFLTNSWIGVMPVSSLRGNELPSRAISEQLREVLEGGK